MLGFLLLDLRAGQRYEPKAVFLAGLDPSHTWAAGPFEMCLRTAASSVHLRLKQLHIRFLRCRAQHDTATQITLAQEHSDGFHPAV